MKLDPNSREELPAVVRVAVQLMAGLYVQADGTAHSLAGTAMLGAHTLIAAYNADQPDEPSATMPTREEMVERLREISGMRLRDAYLAIEYILDGDEK